MARSCGHCGGPLVGRQERWCGKACSMAGLAASQSVRKCAAEGCEAPAKLPYGRYCVDCRKAITRQSIERNLRPEGSRAPTKDGYISIKVNGRIIGEHRHVMEQLLGRPLARGENVHHKNGVRTDNRPENLELWLNPQPYGQRVMDLIGRYLPDEEIPLWAVMP